MNLENLVQNLRQEYDFCYVQPIEVFSHVFFSQKGDDGFVYLNRPSKSIEFWLPFKGEILMATIHAMNIGWIQIDE